MKLKLGLGAKLILDFLMTFFRGPKGVTLSKKQSDFCSKTWKIHIYEKSANNSVEFIISPDPPCQIGLTEAHQMPKE